jgi:hypothetical protein
MWGKRAAAARKKTGKISRRHDRTNGKRHTPLPCLTSPLPSLIVTPEVSVRGLVTPEIVSPGPVTPEVSSPGSSFCRFWLPFLVAASRCRFWLPFGTAISLSVSYCELKEFWNSKIKTNGGILFITAAKMKLQSPAAKA